MTVTTDGVNTAVGMTDARVVRAAPLPRTA
jgi:hypothetical protein